MGCAEVGNHAVVFESLLLAESTSRQESDGMAGIVLESYLLYGVRWWYGSRHDRIGSSVGHRRYNDIGGRQRRKACVLMYQGGVRRVDTDPVIGVIPSVIFSLRVPSQVFWYDTDGKRNRTYRTFVA